MNTAKGIGDTYKCGGCQVIFPGFNEYQGHFVGPSGSRACPDMQAPNRHDMMPTHTGTRIITRTDNSRVDHPAHYGGDTVHETIKCIEAWGLGYALGNAVKYISRAGKKVVYGMGSDEVSVRNATLEDLKKAAWYIKHEIERLESE